MFIFIEFSLFIESCVSTPERPFSPVFDLSKTFSGHSFMWLVSRLFCLIKIFCGRMFDFSSFVQPGTDFGPLFNLRMTYDRLLVSIQFFGRVFNLTRSFGHVLLA